MLRACIPIGVFCAVFASAPASFGEADPEPTALDRPLRTAFRIDGQGKPMRGQVTAWEYGAFWLLRDGVSDPVRIGWDEIDAGKVLDQMRRILGRNDAQGHLRLGIELLRLDEPSAAQRAFRIAEQADRSLRDTVQRATALHLAGGDPIGALEISEINRVTAEREANPAGQDEAASSGAAPEGQAVKDALERVNADGVELVRHETEHFVVYVEGGEEESALIGAGLERIYGHFLDVLGARDAGPICEQKITCYIIETASAYDRVSRALQSDSADPSVKHHQTRYSTRRDSAHRAELLCLYKGKRFSAWDEVLQQGVVRVMIERCHSPEPLPKWAEAGLVMHAYTLAKADEPTATKWMLPSAKAYCRANEASVLFRMNDASTDIRGRGPSAVSHLFVQYLRALDSEGFTRWIKMVKRGHDWEVALEDVYGHNLNALAWDFEATIGAK